MSVVIDKNVSIVTTKTAKVKAITISFGGKKYLEALEECDFKEGDKLEGVIDFDKRSGKVVFNIKNFNL